MRDPNNVIKPSYDVGDKTISIENIPEFDMEDWDLNNEKEFKIYIKRIEKICRTSIEYKQYINYLREYADMNRCSILKHVTNSENYKIKIEIHHEPLTLFDIVMAIFNKRNRLRESLHEELVAQEVMYNHYKLNIGLIPLCETVNELVHNQYIVIPTTAVFGNYRKFVLDYADFIDPEVLVSLKKLEESTLNYSFDNTKKLLNPNLVYINANDDNSPTNEELFKMIKEALDNLKNNK
jgi:hypothetical protein